MRDSKPFLIALVRGRDSTQDDSAHKIFSEFLTGFRKRKQQRVDEKKAKRKEREKRERLETRKQVSELSASVGKDST